MSMYQSRFGINGADFALPAWAKAERYEYCEPYVAQTGRTHRATLLHLVLSAVTGLH